MPHTRRAYRPRQESRRCWRLARYAYTARQMLHDTPAFLLIASAHAMLDGRHSMNLLADDVYFLIIGCSFNLQAHYLHVLSPK